MRDLALLGAFTAFWLGIQTAISPCPLATNIAAISFIGKHIADTKKVLLSGLFYAFGRTLAYLSIAVVIVSSALSVPGLSHFLQKYMGMVLGPVLVLTGMVLLEMLSFTFSSGISAKFTQRLAEKGSILSSGLLGFLFALSFCPISAGLFFAGLVPLSVKYDSTILLPILFGVGTGLPVVLFAFLVVFGVQWVGKVFEQLARIERLARRVSGVIFILVGIYLTLIHVFGVQVL